MKFPLRIYCIKITNRIRIRVLAYKHFDPKHTKMYNYNFITIYSGIRFCYLANINIICCPWLLDRKCMPKTHLSTVDMSCSKWMHKQPFLHEFLLKCMQIVSRCCHNKKTFVMSYYYYYSTIYSAVWVISEKGNWDSANFKFCLREMNFEELGTRDNCCDKSDTAIRSKMVDCHITDKYNNNNGTRRVLYCFFFTIIVFFTQIL